MGTRRRPKGGADGEGVKLLYLAGPFGAPEGDPDPLHTVNENITAASRIALEAAREAGATYAELTARLGRSIGLLLG